MRPEKLRMRDPIGGGVVLAALLAASFLSGPGTAFAQTAAADQYASAAADQYGDATNGQAPVGPNDPTLPGLPNQGPTQAEPSQTSASPDPADAGLARGPLEGPLGAFDGTLTDVSANLDSIGQMLAALGSGPAAAGTVVPNPDRCVPGPGVACVGGGDPLPPPTVAEQCAPGPGVACIGGPTQPGPTTAETGGPGGIVSSLFDALVRQATDGAITPWLVDDPGDADGDGAASTDLNPGSNDADPTDRDGDDRVSSDPDEFDPDE